MYWYRVDGWAVASATVAGQGALFVVLARWAVPPPARAHTRLCLRMPAPSETEAMAELREVIRHGTASSISIRPAGEGDLLRVEVRDDGRGGVDEAAGSGVSGLRRRVAALDGRVTVDGPVGGPTVIGAELPCGS